MTCLAEIIPIHPVIRHFIFLLKNMLDQRIIHPHSLTHALPTTHPHSGMHTNMQQRGEVITSCYHGNKIPGSQQTMLLQILQ